MDLNPLRSELRWLPCSRPPKYRTSQRRCTLACQGCHVSPNGGGLRSYYGKWTEERWLRSFRSDSLSQAKAAAPFKKQIYGRRSIKKSKGKRPRGGFPLREVKDLPQNEKPYDKYADKGEHDTVKTLREFEYYIPDIDPYREMMRNKIDAGMDLRWQINQETLTTKVEGGDSQKTEIDHSFPMAVDFNFGYRPLYRKLRFVYEARAVKSPAVDKKSEKFADALSRRSLYMMVDEIPYNLYVMGGFYRPLFGYYTPDHTLLAQKMQAYALTGTPSAYNLQYEAYSFGGSPNVPYANIHLINRQIGPSLNNKMHGFAANLGGRFVTLSANINYSYWMSSEEKEVEGEKQKLAIEMHSIYASAMFGKFILTLDLASFAKDDPATDFRQGGVYTVDTYYKVWRENYLNVQFSLANVAPDLRPGSGSQIRIGAKSYIMNGLQFSLHYEIEDTTLEIEDEPKVTASKSGILSQIHLYL